MPPRDHNPWKVSRLERALTFLVVALLIAVAVAGVIVVVLEDRPL